MKFAFEFRHSSWFDSDVYDIFKNYDNISLCKVSSPSWPTTNEPKGSFVYIRMHGKDKLYGSSYKTEELKELAEEIKGYLSKGLEVYCYFNNDAKGYAPKNAKILISFLE